MTLIAIEEHWMLPDLATTLRSLPESDESLALNELGDNERQLEDLGAGRIAAMDAQGIDVAILSLTPPGTQPLPAADGPRLSRAANDVAAEAVRAHPSRLRAMATLPMSAPGQIVGELERTVEMGFVGAMVHGRSGRLLLDDPVYDDFFAAAERLSRPVFIHPQIPPRAVRDASYRGFDPTTELGLATFGWGWHVEAATAALRLIVRGTFDRYPNLQIILGHWGELLLFWLDRADSLARIAGLKRSVTDYVRSNVVVTSSGMLNPALLRHILAVTSVDRLVFSTDYPFAKPTREEIASFLQEFDSDADREKFSSTNAAILFGIET